MEAQVQLILKEGIEIKNIKLVSQKKEKSEAVRLGVRPQHLKIDQKALYMAKSCS